MVSDAVSDAVSKVAESDDPLSVPSVDRSAMGGPLLPEQERQNAAASSICQLFIWFSLAVKGGDYHLPVFLMGALGRSARSSPTVQRPTINVHNGNMK